MKKAERVIAEKYEENKKECKELVAIKPKSYRRKAEPSKIGRPRKPITYEDVFKLARIHCTAEEIASVLDCGLTTINDTFSKALRAGQNEGKMSLKRKMYMKALNDNDTHMQIWLAKQHLGHKERQPEEAVNIMFNVQVQEVPK